MNRVAALFAVAVLALAMVATTALAATSREKIPGVLDPDVAVKRTEMMSRAMLLSRAEADAFWPVYREYEREREQLDVRTVRLIDDYMESYQTLDDAKARALLDRLRSEGFAGATVVHGVAGFGASSVIHTASLLELSTDLPVVIEVVDDVPPMDRDIAMVFQNYALYPHMSVYQNMAFGLRMRKVQRSEIDRRVRDAAAILGLSDELLQKKPPMPSGAEPGILAGLYLLFYGREIWKTRETWLERLWEAHAISGFIKGAQNPDGCIEPRARRSATDICGGVE